jgi:hypothetical protein
MDPQLADFLWSLLLRLPVILITIAGIVWAIVNWKQASNAALFVTLACSALLLSSCIFPALFIWLQRTIAQNAPPPDMVNRIIWTNRAILGAWNLCTAVCLGALIFAVFAGRAAALARKERDANRDRRDDNESDRDLDDRIKAC